MSVDTEIRYNFNTDEADRVQAFWEEWLVHTDGIWAGEPFLLRDWQRDEIIRPLYGWQRWDPQFRMWVRKHSKLFMEVARGNGKSEIASGIVLQGLIADGEYGAEVYGGAEDRDQAMAVFRPVMRMIRLSPRLHAMEEDGDLQVIESKLRIVYHPTQSFYQVLPRDRTGEGSQGFRTHVAVLDEYQVQRTRDLVDALLKSMGKRAQALIALILTAGNNPNSPAMEDHDYAVRVLEGLEDDPSLLAFIRNMPRDADPFLESNWNYPNPALGDFLSVETLRQEAREAQVKPSVENYFRQYRCCQWVQQQSRWIPLTEWDENAGEEIEEEDLRGRECFGGLDLAATTDIAALCWAFPADKGSYDLLWRLWIPSERVAELDQLTGGQASVWVRDGLLTAHEGNVIDFNKIEKRMLGDMRRFAIVELAFDPHQGRKLAQDLEERGLVTWEHYQQMAHMAAPTREFERLIYERKLHHGGHPVLRWMANNVAVKRDEGDNIRPDRRASGGKIDGIVAGIMAISAATRRARVDGPVLSWL